MARMSLRHMNVKDIASAIVKHRRNKDKDFALQKLPKEFQAGGFNGELLDFIAKNAVLFANCVQIEVEEEERENDDEVSLLKSFEVLLVRITNQSLCSC